VCCVSDWYLSLAAYTFPTIFIELNDNEIKMFETSEFSSGNSKAIIRKIDHAVSILPGNSFIHADYCAPTDSSLFQKRKGAINSGKIGWDIITGSEKVKKAFVAGKTKRICLHSYRRMDHSREFRVFVKEKNSVAISQKDLSKHYPKLHKRHDFIKKKIQKFIKKICEFSSKNDVVVDLYLTSQDELMILDMNSWGEPTNPLLLRSWDRDWSKNAGLILVNKPEKLGGDVSVSF